MNNTPKPALVIIRKVKTNNHYSTEIIHKTIDFDKSKNSNFWTYYFDFQQCKTKTEAKREARKFCKLYNLKIKKYRYD